MIPGPQNDEWKAIRGWVQAEGKSYTLLHALVGGQDTRSTRIPWNMKIINKINEKIGANILEKETRGAPVGILLNP
jgi:hypothetical protein